ncbi:hypothetical protein ATANTOWER_030388 [Ataeniobius toweri]|uniref:Uncharacterized protein n=1 Tax=Ataeniobius toweri TaxID=208326 RepID=A0ABU7AHV6_9TELE|nr:hypothetical protein [Ataeniobius toweri]
MLAEIPLTAPALQLVLCFMLWTLLFSVHSGSCLPALEGNSFTIKVQLTVCDYWIIRTFSDGCDIVNNMAASRKLKGYEAVFTPHQLAMQGLDSWLADLP